MRKLLIALLAVATLAALGACRGQPSDKEPIHIIPDMDWQPKLQPEKAETIWPDGRSMRPLVDGVVAQGHLDDDEGHATGMVGDKYVVKSPTAVDMKVIHRGQDRFNIYCTPCHDRTGSGQGMAVKHGYPLPMNLTSDRVLGMPDGQIFWTITNGVRNMPSYRKQIPPEDRWAIVSWVRVLGRSQHGGIADVPDDQKGKIETVEVSPK